MESLLDRYCEAKKKGEHSVRLLKRAGKHPFLTALENIEPDLRHFPSVHIGRYEIPIDMIAGTKTESRSQSFSEDYYPLLDEDSEFAQKWEFVYSHLQSDGAVDPINVCEYRHKFYIIEGNKRVSVLKILGALYVPAEIDRILPPRTDDKETRIYYEFVDFFRVCPLYEIEFSEEGYYQELAYILGQDLVHKWPKEVVKTLNAAYTYFCSLYESEGGNHINVTTGDAFLVYLRFYHIESLLNDNPALIRTHIKKLWSEFIAETSDEGLIIADDQKVFSKESSVFLRLRNSNSNTLRAAFIFDGNYRNSGWLYGHELGRNYVNDIFKGRVKAFQYISTDTDESLRKSLDKAVSDGADVIFTLSPKQMRITSQSAIHYPRIKFLNCSMNLPYQAVRTYYCRMYEAKFLMGCLAASIAENHYIGYTATYPIFGE